MLCIVLSTVYLFIVDNTRVYNQVAWPLSPVCATRIHLVICIRPYSVVDSWSRGYTIWYHCDGCCVLLSHKYLYRHHNSSRPQIMHVTISGDEPPFWSVCMTPNYPFFFSVSAYFPITRAIGDRVIYVTHIVRLLYVWYVCIICGCGWEMTKTIVLSAWSLWRVLAMRRQQSRLPYT